MGIKLDMPKAYDLMEWYFIKETMNAFSFHKEFLDIIKEFISSVSFSILLNGSPFGKIIPSRGLRQGDPLSPFLFLLGALVFSQMLIRVEEEEYIHGVKIARAAP